MRRLPAILGLLSLLYGCSDAGYFPYSPHALNPAQIHSLVSSASHSNGVPEGLVNAVVMAESAGDPSAVSTAGAEGLMQLMPATSHGCGVSIRSIRCKTSSAAPDTCARCSTATTMTSRSRSPRITRDRVPSTGITACRRMPKRAPT